MACPEEQARRCREAADLAWYQLRLSLGLPAHVLRELAESWGSARMGVWDGDFVDEPGPFVRRQPGDASGL